MMNAQPATASDVNALLGDVDAVVVERILETGASAEEIGEALRGFEQERGFGEEPFAPSSSRVVEVRAVLDELSLFPDDEDEYGEGAEDRA